MNIQTVIHRWANQIKPKGKSGNVYYEGRTLYSYGEHFVLGHWLKHPALDGGDQYIVVLNTESYSVSTSKHQSWTWSSLPSGTVPLHVPLLRRMEITPESIMERARRCLVEVSHKVSTRAPRKSAESQWEAKRLLSVITSLHELMSEQKPDTSEAEGRIFSEEVNAAIRKWQDGYEERRKKFEALRAEQWRISCLPRGQRELERARKFKPDCTPEDTSEVLLQAWRDGKIAYPDKHNAGGFHLLRVKKNGVETSAGLRLDWRSLAGAYRCLKLGERVAGYPVQAVTEQVITIGCHRIQWSEINLAVQRLSPKQRELVGA